MPKERKASVGQPVAEKLWLLYFNDTLLKKGIISEPMHNRMRLRILSRERKPL